MALAQRRDRRRAWSTVGALFVTQTVACGILFYGPTVYLHALTTQRGLALTVVSYATALLYLASGAAGFPIGRAIERYDPRVTMVASALIGGLGLIAVGTASGLFLLFFGYAVLGVGLAGLSLVPGAVLVARWFRADRALAMSVVSSGYSFGGVVIVPLVAWVVREQGLTAGSYWLGGLLLVGVVPITLALVRTPSSDQPARSVPSAHLSVRLRTNRVFVGVSLAWFFVMFGQVGILSHLFNLISGALTTGLAAAAVSTAAITSLVGRLVAGWIMRYVSAWTFALGLMAWQTASLLVLALGSDAVTLLLATGAFGVTLGTMVMLQALILAEEFTGPGFTKVYSSSNFLATFGWAAGPAAIGVVHDLGGGYTAAVLMIAGTSLLANIVLAVVRPR